MTNTMYIGSGDISALLSGKKTKTHISLMQRFVSGIKPIYNAKASPIDALRTGAIMEERYILTLPDNYYPKYVVYSKEMDVFRSSLDFANIDNGCLVDFDELKTMFFNDFVEISTIRNDNQKLIEYAKKKHKAYYNQIQQQLYCTGLDSANLVFLCVYNYNDEENSVREIKDNDLIKVRIQRDESVINTIKKRGFIFQKIKDCYK